MHRKAKWRSRQIATLSLAVSTTARCSKFTESWPSPVRRWSRKPVSVSEPGIQRFKSSTLLQLFGDDGQLVAQQIASLPHLKRASEFDPHHLRQVWMTGAYGSARRSVKPFGLRSVSVQIRGHPPVRALTPTAEGARSKRVKVYVQIIEGLPMRECRLAAKPLGSNPRTVGSNPTTPARFSNLSRFRTDFS